MSVWLEDVRKKVRDSLKHSSFPSYLLVNCNDIPRAAQALFCSRNFGSPRKHPCVCSYSLCVCFLCTEVKNWLDF